MKDPVNIFTIINSIFRGLLISPLQMMCTNHKSNLY